MIGSFPELKRFPANDKLVLAGELWHQAMNEKGADDADSPGAEFIGLLEGRLVHYLASPETGLPWDEVKRRLAKSNG